jgi:hypothetical protein
LGFALQKGLIMLEPVLINMLENLTKLHPNV